MHRAYQAKDVLEEIKKEKVTQVLCAFTDVLGFVMAQQTPAEEMEQALKRGILIDGSSLEGYARIEESDLRAIPDPRTFRVLPWKIADENVGFVICDVITPEGEPYEGDPRGVLRRLTESLKQERGWTVNMGPELEFFLSASAIKFEPLEQGKYFELAPDRKGLEFRTRVMAALRNLEIKTEVGHHEVAPSQHEIDLRYNEALAMADTVFFYRWMVKELAVRESLHATFMPKPQAGINGSGMHVHQSIFKDGKNLFFDDQDGENYHLSELALQYLGGLLEYVPLMTLVLNQWVNSYKRLVPGYEAPVYVCWGNRNRSALVRKPGYEPGNENATRLELRSADPACNPYLAFAAMIACGLRGIEEQITPPEAVEKDVYHLTPKQREELNISELPGSLAEALELFQADHRLTSVFGSHIVEKLVENKQAELDRWRLAVTDFETREYFSRL